MGAPYGRAPAYSNGGYLLTLIGGFLVILGGISDAAAAAFLGSALKGLGISSGLLSLEIVFGILGVIIGILLIVLAWWVKARPERHETWGIAIILLAIVSWIGGAGFLIGLVLCLVGGIIAYTWRPPAAQMMPPPGWGYGPPAVPAPGAPMAPIPSAAAPIGWFCPACGSPNAVGAMACQRCGAAAPPRPA